MLPFRNMIKLLPRLLMLPILMTIASGCSKGGECNSPAQALIYISVNESPNSSSDIYDQVDTNVDNAIVLIYDKDAQLQRIVKLSCEEIENRTPIEIPIYEGNHPKVVVWGNLNGSEDISDIISGLQLSTARICMQQEDEYNVSTDNLYYGFKELTDESVQEIEITSWVGHVFITARGIDNALSNAGNYFFTIESNCNSYDFYGRPQTGKVLLKMDAEAKSYHDETILVHQSVNLIACSANAGEDESTIIKLYKRTPTGDELMASANMDTDGERIVTRSGENTNVLFDFTNQDDPNVYFILTPWEYIYQWSWW